MTPIGFPEQTTSLLPSGKTYSEDVLGVKLLPVWSNGEQCVSCWRPTWRERLSILVFGRVWLSVLSRHTQPPAYVDGSRTHFERADEPAKVE